MSETPEKRSPAQESNSPLGEKAAPPFPLWRKWVFAFALILGLGGLGLRVAGTTDNTADQVRVSANMSDGADGAKAAQATATTPPGSGGLREKLDTPLGQYLDDWSGPMMQLGFSFVAGFSIGYTLAFFLKATALVAGVLLLMLFGLQYVGVVDVNWLGIQGYYDSLLAWAQPHAGSFRDFIASNLPSSGMAALGIFTGFKKK